ncbi:nucleoside diphosphate kinase regulator [Maricaulis sp.]|uniref:nucleoside diphosphate kinase regulator n=1 Tax=Maricaulis sp. TaxID=1486257 RepID=UPI003A90009A
MAPATRRKLKPAITLTRSDHERLWRLAESLPDSAANVAEPLLAELDRARIVADNKIAAKVVRMGSSLCFTSELGDEKHVTLVFPGEADIEAGKVSILTPIGAALIGLSAGQTIDWAARDGRVRRLTVNSVTQAGDAAKATASHALQP